MQLRFHRAKGHTVPSNLLIASWKVWFKRFADDAAYWRHTPLPVMADDATLAAQIQAGRRFSLDVICRILMPWSYRNDCQIDATFFKQNPGVFELTGEMDTEGLKIATVLPSEAVIAEWDALSYLEQAQLLNHAESSIQADIETSSSDPVVIDDAGIEIIGEDIYPPHIPEKTASDFEFAKALVAWIQEDPFQPMYQRQAVGDAVSGWDGRLSAFFWPNPEVNYHKVYFALEPLLQAGEKLGGIIESGRQWTAREQAQAVKLAREVFLFAGVPQREVDAGHIYQVMQSALNADASSNAKMNSGWTYLAAVATSFLTKSDDRLPLIAYTSRIASSLISRLDFLLVEAGITSLEHRFANIGVIPGWGGTRPREFTLQWPDGYRSWQTQIAVSQLVDDIVTILNDPDNNYPSMPIPGRVYDATGRHLANWTHLGVQMVLFSDGY